MGWPQALVTPVSNHGHHIFQCREYSSHGQQKLLRDVTDKTALNWLAPKFPQKISDHATVFFQQIQDLFAQTIIFFLQLTNAGFQRLDLVG